MEHRISPLNLNIFLVYPNEELRFIETISIYTFSIIFFKHLMICEFFCSKLRNYIEISSHTKFNRHSVRENHVLTVCSEGCQNRTVQHPFWRT